MKYLTFRVEAALFGLILIVGALLRFYSLGNRPLEAGESLSALSAWQIVHGEAPSFWQEPLVMVSTAATFFLFGDSDFTARLMPAIFGVGMVALAWTLRGSLGKVGALGAGILFAFSPFFVYFSRLHSGSIFGATLSLLLVISVFRYLQGGQRGFLLITLAALALLLCSGPIAITTVIALALFFAANLAWGRAGVAEALRRALADRQATTGYVLISLGLFFLVSTSFLLNLSGLGLPSLSMWVRQFDLPSGEPWYYPLPLVAVYEPLALLFGILGAAYTVVRWKKGLYKRASFHSFLIFWSGVSLLLFILAGRKESWQALNLLLPLIMLGGVFIEEMASRLDKDSLRQSAALLVSALVLVVFAVLLLGQLTLPGGRVSWPLWLLVGIALAFLAALTTRAIRSHQEAYLVLILIFPLGLAFATHSAWAANYSAEAVEWLSPSMTSSDVTEMMSEVEEFLSFEGKSEKVVVDANLREPLAWYFRGQSRVVFASQVPPGAALVIAEAGSRLGEGLSGYVPHRAKLSLGWSPPGFDFGSLWRWLIYRQAYGPVASKEAVLYFR